ncbi:MAG: hypothetical protein AAGB93_16545 [Planctomycetota bacterium]
MATSDDDLLRRVACGDLAAEDEAVVARRERDPEFARALEDIDRTLTLLDGVGAAERDLIDGAIADADADDVLLVRDSLRERLAERRSARRRRSFGVILAAAAAVLLIALGGKAAWIGGGEDALPRGLLSGDQRILVPRGVVAAFGELRLDYDELASSKSVVVEVMSAATGEVLVRHGELGTGRWTFSNDERSELRAAGHVRVVVTVIPRVGDPEEFSAEARLSR